MHEHRRRQENVSFLLFTDVSQQLDTRADEWEKFIAIGPVTDNEKPSPDVRLNSRPRPQYEINSLMGNEPAQHGERRLFASSLD
jgi:hypothetical protein